MITEEQIDKIVEKLIERIDEANAVFLKGIGSSIKVIKNISPSEAHKLEQILRYGGKYKEIVRELSKYTELNVQDIDDIFRSYAKQDQRFYEQFYKYKNVPFVPFEENVALKTQTMALSNMVRKEIYDFTRTNVLGYTINGKFMGLRETYNKMLDTAFLNVGQGKETFDAAISRMLKDVGTSGLKTLEFESGKHMRLDSAMRMHLKSRLRELHNENQKIIGEEIDADGYEISVHANPAIDHEEVQGRQFDIEEYEKLNNGEDAVDYKGNTYTLDHDGKNGYRPISELNCYHYIFSIVLGVSKPQYTESQLKKIRDDNQKGFEYEGKHYTNYEGTQMQRTLERKIREQKDWQILGKASDNKELIYKSQDNIKILTNKYNELNEASGLLPKKQRARVSTYKAIAGNTRTFYEENLIGKTYGDITINKISEHILERKGARNVWLKDIEDALNNPLKITETKKDSQGRMSLKYIGYDATIVLNPETGTAVSVWPTGSKTAAKLRGER